MNSSKKSILGSIIRPTLETQTSKLAPDVKKHRWLSSPYWPAKGLFQYTCSACGAKVVGKGSPHIQGNMVFTIQQGELINSGHIIKCHPWNWSPDWPPTKKKNK